jgi:hypothetical protein
MKKSELIKLIKEEISLFQLENIEMDYSPLEPLEQMLKSHDFYYSMSDDSRVYDRGLNQLNAIKKEMKRLSDEGMTEEVMTLYQKYAPEGWIVNINEEEAEEEIEDEVEGEVEDNIKLNSSDDDVINDIQNNLENALEAARNLGDEKLTNQIGNTLTFLMRTHIVQQGNQSELNESYRMKKLAGLIK